MNNTFQPKYPNAIRLLRLARGLSTSSLGKQIDVSQSLISRAELKGHGIGKANWNKLADFFGVAPWELHDPTLPQKRPELFSK
jgi:transcriptional regulator with XRE-family HTH domain